MMSAGEVVLDYAVIPCGFPTHLTELSPGSGDCVVHYSVADRRDTAWARQWQMGHFGTVTACYPDGRPEA